MDTRPTEESLWLAELDPDLEEQIGQEGSPVEETRLTRIHRWFENLGINAKLIAKELPMIIKSFRSKSRALEMSKVQFYIPASFAKHRTMTREAHPRVFQTNADTDLHYWMLGRDIAEYVYNKEREGLEENEAFHQIQLDSHYQEIDSLAAYRCETMKKLSRSHAIGNITDAKFLKELRFLYDSASPEVKDRISDLYIALHDKNGFKAEREKETARIRKQKSRANLRLVGENEGKEEATEGM